MPAPITKAARVAITGRKASMTGEDDFNWEILLTVHVQTL
jgi:hypothetical protein